MQLYKEDSAGCCALHYSPLCVLSTRKWSPWTLKFICSCERHLGGGKLSSGFVLGLFPWPSGHLVISWCQCQSFIFLSIYLFFLLVYLCSLPLSCGCLLSGCCPSQSYGAGWFRLGIKERGDGGEGPSWEDLGGKWINFPGVNWVVDFAVGKLAVKNGSFQVSFSVWQLLTMQPFNSIIIFHSHWGTVRATIQLYFTSLAALICFLINN